jgi:hypothetical protein
MGFSADNLQQIKRAIHIAQAVFIFIAWIIMIAVFHSALQIDSRPGWYFALVRTRLRALHTTLG